jgi:hypothetical protein
MNVGQSFSLHGTNTSRELTKGPPAFCSSLWYNGTMADPLQPIKTPAQEARAMAEREANARAKAAGESLPFPNMWDALDPTKVAEGATPEEIHQSYLEFIKLCPPRPRQRYTVS